MFEVEIARRAIKTAKKIPLRERRKVVELLLTLRENPVPSKSYDLTKMKGYKDTFRARIGDFRVVYEVSWSQRTINVLVIKARENAYE